MDGVEIRRESIESPLAHQLITELDAELTERYPEPGATHFELDAGEVAPGRGAFLVALIDGEAVGCGAVRRVEESVAEVKRMYVHPAARGRGVGGHILAALESEARGLGARRLVLERGARQPDAIALNRRFGFAVIPPFGEYVDSPLSVCMAKDLG